MPPDCRSVAHINVADFAVAVERIVDRRLAGRPVAVAGSAGPRSYVYDMSDEAYRAGVRKGQLLRHARKRCPDLTVVPPHPGHYQRAMSALIRRAGPYSPLIEAGESNGHLFIDLTGTSRLHGPPPDVAWRIRKTVRADLGLDPIWSIAPNKLLAKVATRIVKPDGEYILKSGDESDFLSPLPLVLLPGLEPPDLSTLREFNLRRIGQVTPISPAQLEVIFGRRGRVVHRAVLGVDPSPVLPLDHQPLRIEKTHVFDQDTNDYHEVRAAVSQLVDRAGFEARNLGRVVRRVGVWIDYADGRRTVRSQTHRVGAAHDQTLYQLAAAALENAWGRRVRIQRVQVVCDRLVHPPAQLDLFDAHEAASDQNDQLDQAFDRIKRKFGPQALTRGRGLKTAA